MLITLTSNCLSDYSAQGNCDIVTFSLNCVLCKHSYLFSLPDNLDIFILTEYISACPLPTLPRQPAISKTFSIHINRSLRF